MTPTTSLERDRPVPKQPYRAPRLIVYGTMQSLTAVKRGTMSDGSMKPATRLSGTMT